jgi:hypothetical protein
VIKEYTSRAGDIAQMVQNLPTKHEAMSSNPSLPKDFFFKYQNVNTGCLFMVE